MEGHRVILNDFIIRRSFFYFSILPDIDVNNGRAGETKVTKFLRGLYGTWRLHLRCCTVLMPAIRTITKFLSPDIAIKVHASIH